jgi:hypothetical protein
MLKRLLASAVLVLFVSHANAQFLTGNDLVEYMRADDKSNRGHPNPDYFKVGIYTGFVIAVVDAYHSAGMLCGLDQVTGGQAKAIVSRYLKANPTKWNSPAVDLAREALRSAFPCPK